ncbi:MAG: DNA mismatch repair endonuclease MutL [Gemmatimonadaceae bacterium]
MMTGIGFTWSADGTGMAGSNGRNFYFSGTIDARRQRDLAFEVPHIAVLSSAVADQIAAGEVVERPASVVKELIENALDAGASSLEVSVEDGGRGAIRVSDDGCGMDRGDAILALARHATSKIRQASDLVGVTSYGFRGEALPAICSVSEVEIQTALGDGLGTRIQAVGGSIVAVTDVARRAGTTVVVDRLFYNAPARRKFLRGARSEWRAIADAMSTVALVRWNVRLTLSHNGKVTLSLSPASSLLARVSSLWGADYASRFIAVDTVVGSIRVAGLAERPGDVGMAGRRTFVAVNGRAVRDVGVVRAAEAAYRSTLPAGLRPSLFLFLSVPADSVDVNVHPAKAEVRFADRWATERAVEQAVRRALGSPDSIASLATGSRGWVIAAPFPVPARVDVEVLRGYDRVGAALAGAGAVDTIDIFPSPPKTNRDTEDANGKDPVVPPLTQLRRTYILFERDDGVILVDQHSAHERVLYERFVNALSDGVASAQRLLFPLTLHLAPAEADAFEAHRDLFERVGFEIDGFGGHTLLVAAVPMPHSRFDAEKCLRETLAALAGDRVPTAAPRHERLAATIACKGAIKAGDALGEGEMRALYRGLAATTLPAHDVHGRATIVHLGWDELERRFGRR